MSTKRVFLLPGELMFAREPTRVSTLLGSCVAVCLHDRKRKWGGMNHFMLPRQEESRLAPGKCGDFAIQRLVAMAREAGCHGRDLVASVYGGGKVTGHLGSVNTVAGFDIGARNIEVARTVLGKYSIEIARQDTGGTRGRKVHMNTATNEIAVAEIVPSNKDVATRERLEQFKQRKIRVLVVDDSAVVRGLLRKGIELTDDMEVVGEAADPYEAREKILEVDPDVLCLDIIMPRMDGLAFLKKVMRYRPIPTVIVSTIAKEGSAMWKKAVEAGAVGVVDKEELEIYKGTNVLKRALLPKLRRAARAAVDTRRAS